MGRIIVIGSSNTDMVITSSNLPAPGETVLGNEFNMFPGGKGANQAVAAARAGGDVLFIAKVGNDDFGKKSIEKYKTDKINTEKIVVDLEKPSGVAVIVVDEVSGQNSIIVAPGSNSELSIKDIENSEDEIKNADIVLVQLEIPIKVAEFALKIAKKHSVKTILNPAPAHILSDEFLSYVDIITPNEIETQFLTGVYPDSNQNLQQAATKLLTKVNEGVIITLAEKGAFLARKHLVEEIIPSVKVKNTVDSTAAGDVFNGYLAALLSDGINCKEAVALSNKAAAISVTRKGAQPSIPKFEELQHAFI